jgi:hypothetical protein
MKMPKILLRSVTVVLLSATAAFAAPQTLNGTLTDSMCAKSSKHMMPSATDAECVRACVRMGAKWALVSGGKIYLLQGDPAKFNNLAGKRVAVTGEVNAENVVVQQIAAAK